MTSSASVAALPMEAANVPIDTSSNNPNLGVGATKKVVFSYPMVRESDMNEEMKAECLELCVNACERHSANNESAAKAIKEALDKRFGVSWHVVVGEGFGFEISYELKNMMYMFFAGNLAVCVWKCS